jgi:hypothetical protein
VRAGGRYPFTLSRPHDVASENFIGVRRFTLDSQMMRQNPREPHHAK